MSDPRMIALGGRRRGRPSLSPSEKSSQVLVALPDSMFDKACHAASVQRISVPELLRRGLKRLLVEERGGEFKYPK